MTIRKVRASDMADYVDLYEAVAAEGRWIGGELPIDRAVIGGRVERALRLDDLAIFVAEQDGRFVGSIGLASSAGVVEFGMMVAATVRGAGLGSALLTAGIDWARARDAHKVSLEVWPHNERAINLYKRHGFEIEGRRRRHWRRNNGELWDGVLMGLVLNEESPGPPAFTD